jgi:hypothetical protein
MFQLDQKGVTRIDIELVPGLNSLQVERLQDYIHGTYCLAMCLPTA